MSTVINDYRRRQAPSPTHCDPRPPECPTCGRLECLCRPRFFAGQVLTADDLNRLDHYIRGKHRLHNRQLHGWGVVNGLEVTCDVCGEGVVVGCGYALSPCGEDIVVCDPVVVDVCKLIGECREKDRHEPCDPPREPSPRGCEDGEEEWVLAIRYSESPTRAVKPLMSSAGECGCSRPARTSCSCGGGTRGHCSCQGVAPRKTPRNAPVQCEPTVVCEGFDFEVYRKPPEPDPGKEDRRLRLNPDSELYKRWDCCVDRLVRRMPTAPGPFTVQNVQQDLAAWHQWICRFKDFLLDYLSRKPGYNCELLARLQTIVCPPLNVNNAAQLLIEALTLLVMVWLDALLACICSALLPPCPTPRADDLVPLATVKVSGADCRVLTICNWTIHRKFATTFPSLKYWLGILPFGVELRKMIEKLCCFQIMAPAPQTPPPTHVATPFAEAQPEAPFATAQPMYYERGSQRLNPRVSHGEGLSGAAAMAARAFGRGAAPLDPQALFESVFLPESEKGDAHLSELELANLPQFLALNQILRPMARESLSLEALSPALAAVGVEGPGAAPGASAEEVASLREELKKVRAEVAAMKKTGGAKKAPARKKRGRKE